MFYMMPGDLTNNALQSWFAAARDQATMQMIASLSMQKQVQSEVKKNLESCVLYVEDQVDASVESIAPPVAPSRTAVKGVRTSRAQ